MSTSRQGACALSLASRAILGDRCNYSGICWTIGGANAIRALRSPSLSGRYGGRASLETNACTPALVLPRLPAIGSHDGSARYTGRELRVSLPSLTGVPHATGSAPQLWSGSTRFSIARHYRCEINAIHPSFAQKVDSQAHIRPFSSMVCASAITASLTGHAFRFRYIGLPGCCFG